MWFYRKVAFINIYSDFISKQIYLLNTTTNESSVLINNLPEKILSLGYDIHNELFYSLYSYSNIFRIDDESNTHPGYDISSVKNPDSKTSNLDGATIVLGLVLLFIRQKRKR